MFTDVITDIRKIAKSTGDGGIISHARLSDGRIAQSRDDVANSLDHRFFCNVDAPQSWSVASIVHPR